MNVRPMVRILALGVLLASGSALGQAIPGQAITVQDIPAAPLSKQPLSKQPKTQQPQTPRATVMARGRSLAQSFYDVKVDVVWAAFAPPLRGLWGSLADFKAYREMGVREYGAESRLVDERVIDHAGLHFYVRDAVFAKHPDEVWSVVFGFDDAGVVQFFTIAPADNTTGEDPLRT